MTRHAAQFSGSWAAVLLLALTAACAGAGGATTGGEEDETDFVNDWDFPDDGGDGIEGDDAEAEADEVPPGTPTIVVSPAEELNFGAVLLGRSGLESVTIENRGGGLLVVRTVELLNNPRNVFEIVEPPATIELPPFATQRISVRYTPDTSSADSAQLQIVSNDTAKPAVRIALKSEFKGVSRLRLFDENDAAITTYAVPFGNASIGGRIEKQLKICNLGTENKTFNITGVVLQANRIEHFTLALPREISQRTPFTLPPAPEPSDLNCLVAQLAYHPARETVWPETLKDAILIENNADTAFDKNTPESPVRVTIEGTSSSNTVRVAPNPLDFGRVIIGQSKTLSVRLQNQGAVTANITALQIEDRDLVADFAARPKGGWTLPKALAANEQVEIEVAFRPVEPTSGTSIRPRNDRLIIRTDLQDSEVISVALKGTPRRANIPPLAQIALAPRGPDVQVPVQAQVGLGSPFNFYGDISYDPDRADQNANGILEYEWTLTKPDGSSMEFWPTDYTNGRTANVGFLFPLDLPGNYAIQLRVKDEDGEWSQPKKVFLFTGGQDTVTVTADYTGDGLSDVNVQWIAPNGRICDPTTMNAARSCDLLQFGAAVVTASCVNYDQCHRESIAHTDAPNGAYQFGAKFIENCTVELPLVINVCDFFFTTDSDVTFSILINGRQRWTRRASLSNKGDEVRFSINKLNGVFQEPSP